MSGLINFFSVCIGGFYNRIRELSIRKGLGSSNASLFYLLFSETTIVVLGALLFSLILTEVFAYYYNIIDPFMWRIHASTLLKQQLQYYPGLILLNAVIAFFVSSRLRRMAVAVGVRGGNKNGNRHHVRNFLLGFQFLVFFLFFGAGTFVQLQYNASKKMVFSTLTPKDRERIFEIHLSYPQLKNQSEVILAKLQSGKSVEDILQSNMVVTVPSSMSSYLLKEGEAIEVSDFEFSDNYVSFFDLPLTLNATSESENSVVISRALYDRLGDEKNTGIIVLDSIGYNISGIVDNYVNNTREPKPFLSFKPLKQTNYLYVKSYSGYEKETLQLIHTTIKEFLTEGLPYEIRSIDEVINVRQWRLTVVSKAMFLFTIICLIITLLGVYSSITVDTEKRQKEVAIRKVNGAMFKDIIWLFGKLYAKVLGFSFILALPLLILIADFFVKSFSVRINYFNPLIWLSILLIIALFVTITVAFRLYRIAQINPAEVIKSE